MNTAAAKTFAAYTFRAVWVRSWTTGVGGPYSIAEAGLHVPGSRVGACYNAGSDEGEAFTATAQAGGIYG